MTYISSVITLIPVLGDQLTPTLSSLARADPATSVVLMMEVWDETQYVRHHKKKIALLFSAMRHFAEELRAAGWTVDYVALEDPSNTGSFTGEVGRAVAKHGATRIRVTEPGEYRVEQMMLGWSKAFGLPVDILSDDRFFCSRPDFAAWAKGKAKPVMEFFYRDQRARHGVLMRGGKPEGERWNFDAENRKTPPRGLNYPAPIFHEPDAITREVLSLVQRRFGGHFGDLEPFGLAVTRAQALQSLEHFIQAALPRFGDYQDAMVTDQPFLYHSFLSPALNCGLLTAREVVAAAEDAYRRGEAPLNAVEGFVRQILGWREFVRGMYWLDMPDYEDANFFGNTAPLPDFYWTGETDMRCARESVDQTVREGYAHHIQRLMVLGNFALIAGVAPRRIDAWYLVVYADAYQWVELPNVIGMSQFADGGRLGTKPYASSGAYIDRMSDYCGRCRYDVKAKTGPDACPFNALYWDFHGRNADKLRGNPRLRNVYRNWDRMSPERQSELRASAAAFLRDLTPEQPGWDKADATGVMG